MGPLLLDRSMLIGKEETSIDFDKVAPGVFLATKRHTKSLRRAHKIILRVVERSHNLL